MRDVAPYPRVQGVNIALDLGNLFQGVAVAVFVYTVLEERKLLVGLESEQRDEFKKFDEKKALQRPLQTEVANKWPGYEYPPDVWYLVEDADDNDT